MRLYHQGEWIVSWPAVAWSAFLVWSYLRLTSSWRQGHGAGGGCGEEEEG